jgi:drug/metabolite transporter (DMT)-like permease
MEWVWFAIAMLGYVVSCNFAFHEEFRRNSPWFIPINVLIGVALSTIWYINIRNLDDKDRIYFYGVVWDMGIVLTYYILPIIFFEVKLNRFGLAGVGFMIFGMLLLKLK